MSYLNAQMSARTENEAHVRALPLDTAQLVSVALYTPKPDQTVQFFYEMLGHAVPESHVVKAITCAYAVP